MCWRASGRGFRILSHLSGGVHTRRGRFLTASIAIDQPYRLGSGQWSRTPVGAEYGIAGAMQLNCSDRRVVAAVTPEPEEVVRGHADIPGVPTPQMVEQRSLV